LHREVVCRTEEVRTARVVGIVVEMMVSWCCYLSRCNLNDAMMVAG
jgi:hypothetical protein